MLTFQQSRSEQLPRTEYCMRLLVAIALLATSVFTAEARDANTPTAAAEAGRQLFLSVTADDQILEMVEAYARAQLPEMNARLSASPQFETYTAEHQTALLAALETVPVTFRAEFARDILEIADRTAPRFADLMSAEDMAATANAIRAPDNRPLLEEFVRQGLSGYRSESAFPDLTRTESGRQFLLTRAGREFLRQRPRLDEIIEEESRTMISLGPRLRMIGMAIACDALQGECPESTRRRLGRN